MTRLCCWRFLPALSMLALPLFGQNSIELGSAIAEIGTDAEISITTNSDSEVQGVVVVIEISGGTGKDLIAGPAIAEADTIVRRVEADYAILGVVLDSDGLDGEVIPPGAADLGTLVVTAGGIAGDFDITLAPDCSPEVDCYTLVSGGPPLDNIIVIGGQWIGRGERLETVGGTLSVRECLSRMFIGGSPNDAVNNGEARVMLRNCEAVEGFVVALCHDPEELELATIDVGDDAVDAEFAAVEISACPATCPPPPCPRHDDKLQTTPAGRAGGG